jgi:hypothetical protein
MIALAHELHVSPILMKTVISFQNAFTWIQHHVDGPPAHCSVIVMDTSSLYADSVSEGILK